MISPKKWSFTIYGNATFSRRISLRDSAGAPVVIPETSKARMQLREAVGSPVLLDLNDANGYLVIESGQLVIDVPPAITRALAFDVAEHDIRLEYQDGSADRVLGGTARFSPAITSEEVL